MLGQRAAGSAPRGIVIIFVAGLSWILGSGALATAAGWRMVRSSFDLPGPWLDITLDLVVTSVLAAGVLLAAVAFSGLMLHPPRRQPA